MVKILKEQVCCNCHFYEWTSTTEQTEFCFNRIERDCPGLCPRFKPRDLEMNLKCFTNCKLKEPCSQCSYGDGSCLEHAKSKGYFENVTYRGEMLVEPFGARKRIRWTY